MLGTGKMAKANEFAKTDELGQTHTLPMERGGGRTSTLWSLVEQIQFNYYQALIYEW